MVEKSEPFKLKLFNLSLIVIYITYILTFLGITYIDKSKIRVFSIIIQFVICLILLIRFNPFINHEMTDFDKTIIFSAASFLFINLFITEIYSHFNKNQYNEINNIVKNINIL